MIRTIALCCAVIIVLVTTINTTFMLAYFEGLLESQHVVPKGPAWLTSPVHCSTLTALSIARSSSNKALGAQPHP